MRTERIREAEPAERGKGADKREAAARFTEPRSNRRVKP
jgi:hypothetical protein